MNQNTRKSALVLVTGENHTTQDYRSSMAEGGPLYGAWKNKPHRLVYDLCAEIERREEELLELRELSKGRLTTLLEAETENTALRGKSAEVIVPFGSPCPAEWRKGIHEWYVDREHRGYCRACGAKTDGSGSPDV